MKFLEVNSFSDYYSGGITGGSRNLADDVSFDDERYLEIAEQNVSGGNYLT